MHHNSNQSILMTRRRFLKATMASTIVGFGGGLSGCATNQFTSSSIGTAIVIGAGMGGLVAARDLQRAGYGVVVLEGQDQVGGRIQTNRSLGIPVELGADRIRGTKKNPIMPFIDDAGVKFVPFEWDNLSGVSSEGIPMDIEKLNSSKPDLLKMLTRAFIRNIGRAGDSTVSEIVDKEKKIRTWTTEENEILNFSLGSGEIVSGSSFAETSWKNIRDYEEYKGGDQMVINGYDALPKLLSHDLDIRKNQNVRAIDYSNQGVHVTTNKTTFDADFAVITVSLGVLQSESITFTPELPWRKKRAIGRMGMGQLNKIALRYPKQFWPEDYHALVHGSDHPGNFPAFINLARYTGEPVLIAHIPASYRNALDGISDEDFAREAHQALQAMYGTDIPSPTRVTRSDWGKNPFTLGAFSYNKIGAKTDDRQDLARAVEDRLFFAGEATHRKKYGSVEGAYLTGERAAREVIRATSSSQVTT